MKKILVFSILLCATQMIKAQQEFQKQLVTARTSYTSSNLSDARFAMEQMLQEIDILVGKEILKILPLKMEDKTATPAKDEVTGASAYGVTISRYYGAGESGNVEVQILTNSPVVSAVNSLLSMPFIGSSGDNKVIKISGYKAMVQKSGDKENPEWEVQLPLNTTMISLKAPGYTYEKVVKMANTIPVSQIAKMIQ